MTELETAAVIARMQDALIGVDLDDDTARAAAYIKADINDVHHALYDAHAVRTERIRRQLFEKEIAA